MFAVPFLVLFLASSVFGQSVQPGQCNGGIPAQENLVPSMFEGAWHQIERVHNTQEIGQCSSTNYEIVNDNTIRVINREVYNETEIFRNGTAMRSDSTGRFIVTYEGNINYPYWILSTDYQNYALIYSCTNVDNSTRSVNAWKFSRTTALGTTQQGQINAVISLYPELSSAPFVTVSHSTESCRINGASVLTSSLVLLSAAIFTVYKKSF